MGAEPDWDALRARMVAEQLAGRDIVDAAVLTAMGEVPRHRFVPLERAEQAYMDRPLALGHGATISQPYIVAYMLQLAEVRPGHRVLDVGSGCGYQAAVAAAMGATVFGLEIVDALATRSRHTLADVGASAVTIRTADGRAGWPEEAPFDAIVVGAAPLAAPPALVEQLAVGGALVVPVGGRDHQRMHTIRRTESGCEAERGIGVRFVPLLGNDAL